LGGKCRGLGERSGCLGEEAETDRWSNTL